ERDPALLGPLLLEAGAPVRLNEVVAAFVAGQSADRRCCEHGRAVQGRVGHRYTSAKVNRPVSMPSRQTASNSFGWWLVIVAVGRARTGRVPRLVGGWWCFSSDPGPKEYRPAVLAPVPDINAPHRRRQDHPGDAGQHLPHGRVLDELGEQPAGGGGGCGGGDRPGGHGLPDGPVPDDLAVEAVGLDVWVVLDHVVVEPVQDPRGFGALLRGRLPAPQPLPAVEGQELDLDGEVDLLAVVVAGAHWWSPSVREGGGGPACSSSRMLSQSRGRHSRARSPSSVSHLRCSGLTRPRLVLSSTMSTCPPRASTRSGKPMSPWVAVDHLPERFSAGLWWLTRQP